MTREEAIKIIKECRVKGFKYTFYTVNEYHAALEMAIEALENEGAVVDRVLEIIDEVIDRDVEYAKDENDEALKKCIKRSIDTALDIRDAVAALKGEHG